ncbi:ATP synthase gamma chain [Caulifigura coniformis]|uniref:ATP synthase gamma chain n=1 Tax=Caulifigura coniformis TaxID=2527983 RepID=A0A517SBR5_9PLAN|nr:ATP synthase F1 subunit gamma [Caulifigura coniformis]QDT53580.1 ATP synthase gamma chain [Caulifigura coniformis]
MAKARSLVTRRKSIRNIRKITRTMELIATARFKKAMDRASEAAAYTRKLSEIVADLSQASLSFSHPLLKQPEKVENGVLLVLTSNRGLCGGYNSAVLRLAVGRLREAKTTGENLSLEVSGKRGLNFMKYEQYPVSHAYSHFEDKPRFDEAEVLANRYIADFIAGRIQRVEVAYTKFLNAARQVAVVETLLPIGDLSDEAKPKESSRSNIEYEFLPSAQEIQEQIVPEAFKARLFKCFLDAAVSEQIARRVAMKAATENADDMIRSISLQYNRARQSQITSELSEIIGGAAALE